MYDTETGSRLVKEMIDHDVNHPSIVIWSNGNEGGHNLDLDVCLLKKIFRSVLLFIHGKLSVVLKLSITGNTIME